MTDGSQPKKLQVFISYSRRDLAFVDRLQSTLRERGIAASVDRTDIAKGEEWWKRIQQLITEADTIVFVLSPASAGSEICQQEVDFAETLRKRIVPIVAEDVSGLEVPDALARLNYVFFIPNNSAGATGIFEDALDDLGRTLETDVPWIREHTRVGGLAQRWQGHAGGQGWDLLLRGAELEAAERWMASRPVKAPDLSDAHIAFLTESRRAATRRQRWWIGGASAVALGAIALAGVALNQSIVAGEQRDVAETRRRETVLLRQETQKTESGLLARAASQVVEDSLGRDAGTAILLALEALPDKAAGVDRPYVPEAEMQLDRSFRTSRERFVLTGHDKPVSIAAWRHDGNRIATVSEDQRARVWDATTGKELVRFKGHDHEIESLAWSPDGSRIVTASRDKTARVWDAATGVELAKFAHDDWIWSAKWSPDGNRIASTLGEAGVRVWDAATGSEIVRLEGQVDVRKSAAWSPDGTRLTAGSEGTTVHVWDAATGKVLARLEGHSEEIVVAAWSPEGTRIVTGSTDGQDSTSLGRDWWQDNFPIS